MKLQGAAICNRRQTKKGDFKSPLLDALRRSRRREKNLLNHRVEHFQIRIFLREIAKGAVHLEADLQVRFGVVDIAEKRFVATHVVIINRFLEQGDGTGDKELSGFG